MIEWVDEKLRAWGRAKWRTLKDNGYPESIFGRIMEYGPSAGDHQHTESFREGMTGYALEASIAILTAIHFRRMTDRQYETLFVHYAVRDKSVDEKWKALGYSTKAGYYQSIHRAQSAMEGFLPNEDTEYA